MKSVIVHGPQGCGKTLQADKLRKHFGLSHVVEEFEYVPRHEIRPEGTLYLTAIDPQTYHDRLIKALGIRVVPFEDAMQQIATNAPSSSAKHGGLPS